MAIAHRSLLLLAALCAGPAGAAEPFTPIHQPPPCSAAINRGAQAALDQMASKLRSDHLLSQASLMGTIATARTAGQDVIGLEEQVRINDDRYWTNIRLAILDKADELITFAQRKYRCTPVIYEPIP